MELLDHHDLAAGLRIRPFGEENRSLSTLAESPNDRKV
jgi:hypothetical protein